jgi:cytochrome c553
MRAIGLLFLAGVAVAQAPSPFQPVATVSQIMLNMTYPLSDSLLYIERNPPKDEKDWKVVENTSLMLAESGNLLMIGFRARDQEGWMRDSKLLVEAGVAASKAARTKDVNAILALNDQIVTSCTECHTHYRPGYGQRRRNNQK